MPGGHPLSCVGICLFCLPNTGTADEHDPPSKHTEIGVSLGPQACVVSSCHLSHLPSSRETLKTSTLLLASEPRDSGLWGSVQGWETGHGPWWEDLLILGDTVAFLRRLPAQMCSASYSSFLWQAARQLRTANCSSFHREGLL